MRAEPDQCLDRVVMGGRLNQVYNEQNFLDFLAIERKRSERWGRPVLLLLVDLNEEQGASARIDSMVASKLFSNLWRCLSETDFVGWYREERVAGAVLTELGSGRPTEFSRLITQRVSEILGERLPPNVTRRLRLRLYHEQPELERIVGGGAIHSVLF